MKFGPIANPQQVATMARVAEALCRHAGIKPGTPEHLNIAEKVLALHETGLRNERDLLAAIILPPGGAGSSPLDLNRLPGRNTRRYARRSLQGRDRA